MHVKTMFQLIWNIHLNNSLYPLQLMALSVCKMMALSFHKMMDPNYNTADDNTGNKYSFHVYRSFNEECEVIETLL